MLHFAKPVLAKLGQVLVARDIVVCSFSHFFVSLHMWSGHKPSLKLHVNQNVYVLNANALQKSSLKKVKGFKGFSRP